MPNRTILNKYGLFVSNVHKVLKKKTITEQDGDVINKARLIAMLSSRCCWKAGRYLRSGDSFDREAIIDEIKYAFTDGWKEVSENDIKEVVNSEIDPHAFSMILLYSLDRGNRKEYSELLPKLKEEFVDGMEPIELEV